MTEYEMAYLLNELQNTISNQSSNAFTTVTAFLVAGYLAAHQLSRSMLMTVIGVYTVWLFGAVANLLRTVSVAQALAGQMIAFASSQRGLAWHPIARAHLEWAPAMYVLTIAIFAIVYLASVAFFFHCRRVNSTVGATAPQAATEGNVGPVRKTET